MNNDLFKIIRHYGVEPQQRKLAEEVFELQDAITTHELKQSVEYEIPLTELVGTKEHITEEIADVCVLLRQFMAYYDITQEDVNDIMLYKIGRQIGRIENETH
jgi:NTP pyrophosphatase (non-canonical NTP hydrolase)